MIIRIFLYFINLLGCGEESDEPDWTGLSGRDVRELCYFDNDCKKTLREVRQHAKLQCERCAILQRLKRLGQDVPQRCQSPDDGPPPYDETKYTRTQDEDPEQKEISELHLQLKDVVLRMVKLHREMPNDRTFRMYSKLRSDTDDEERPDLWYKNSDLCSARGGCCARDCGCCAKSLGNFPVYVRSENALERKHHPVYSHCTAECACCIKARGVYKPDPRLPKPLTVPEL